MTVIPAKAKDPGPFRHSRFDVDPDLIYFSGFLAYAGMTPLPLLFVLSLALDSRLS